VTLSSFTVITMYLPATFSDSSSITDPPPEQAPYDLTDSGRWEKVPIPRWEQILDGLILSLGRTPWGNSGTGRARGLLRIFPVVERLLQKGHDIRLISKGGYARYEISRFQGQTLALSDGSNVEPRDLVVIVHFDNRVLAGKVHELRTKRALAWWMYRTAEEDFTALADLARAGAIPQGVRAVWSETTLHPALARMGFHRRPVARSLRAPFARLYFLALQAVYGPPGLTGAQALHHDLGEVWLSMDELKHRFRSARVRN
jgi:hypothetical protein